MATPRVELDRRALFWRLAVFLFAIRQLGVWAWMQRLPLRPGRRLALFLFHRHATPRSVFYALAIAGGLTLLLDLLVGTLLRPLLARWLAPRVDDSAGLFRLGASEWIIESMPARCKQGWLWRTGTLARTNRRLWFFPGDWDVETWSMPLDEAAEVRLRPAARVAWGFLRNWPDQLEVRGDEGPPQRFAPADPLAALSWFHPPRMEADLRRDFEPKPAGSL